MRRPHWGWWLASGALAWATDLAGTAWALAHLSHHRSVVILGGLVRLHLVTNTGAAFGLGAGYEPVVAVLSAVGLVLLSVLAARARARVVAVGLGCAVGGGLGNLTERVVGPAGLLHGPVVDWIHLSFYGPTFNLADVWLRAGLVAALAGALLGPLRPLHVGSPALVGDDRPTGPALGMTARATGDRPLHQVPVNVQGDGGLRRPRRFIREVGGPPRQRSATLAGDRESDFDGPLPARRHSRSSSRE